MEFNKVIREVYANGPRVQEMHQEVMSKYDMMTVGESPGITKEVAKDLY